MTIGDRETLIARIRQLRRTRAAAGNASPPATTRPDPTRLAALEARIEHLEQLVEGLQDAVHRETSRQATLIAELQAQVQPDTMSAALSRDARARGL